MIMALLRCFLLVFVEIACHVDIAAGEITFTSSPTTPTVAENAATGATVVTVTASDVTYILESQDPDEDPKVFAIDSDSGEVTVGDKTYLDFERTQTYTLKIKATQKIGSETGTATVTVTVTDVNEAPTFAEAPYSACVSKDFPAGTTVTQVTATDVDVDDVLTYAIASGNTGDVFAVSGAGIIKVAADKTVGDTPASYSLALVAADDDASPLSGTATVSVTLDDSCPLPTTATPENSAMTAMIPFRVLSFCVFITVFNFWLFL